MNAESFCRIVAIWLNFYGQSGGHIKSTIADSFPFIGGVSYFPGVITVILPTVMSIVVIVALIRGYRAADATPGGS